MLNKIEKGMSNAAEKINENFEELSKVERIDVSDSFNSTGAENIEAYLVGKTLHFTCTFIPSSTKSREEIASTSLVPMMDYSLICSLSSINNLKKSVSAEIREDGTIIVVAENTSWSGLRISGKVLIK